MRRYTTRSIRRIAARTSIAAAAFCLAAGVTLIMAGATWAGKGMPIGSYLERPEYQALLDTLEHDHDFTRDQLMGWFQKVELHKKVVKIFEKPAEAKPYHEYRGLFISPRVQRLGETYLSENHDLLRAVEVESGVPSTVVAAIMGIETKFGSVSGGYRAFDVLNSAFALYPRRRTFFRKELVQYLLLCREEGVDPFTLDGSYAGALGMPQFMPSSFRAYAVDFDGDGRRDIWKSHADVAGSIANYLKVHGWKRGEPLKAEVTLTPAQAARFNGGHKKKVPLSRLISAGVSAPEFDRVSADAKVAVVSYDEADGQTRHFVVFKNFASIMKYNISVNYAMVASELDDYFRKKA